MEIKNPAIRYLLKIDKEFSIHQRNLRAFFSPPLMNSLFVFTNNENVRQFQILSTGLKKLIIMDLYSPPASEKLIIMDLYSPPA